jgi:LysW-gamma-L-lysine/LysW-L-ornithine aminotransferase
VIPERWLLELNPYPERGIRLVRGEGAFVWDDEDRRYLDLGVSGGTNLVGHANPAVNMAISSQVEALADLHPSFELDARQELVEALSVFVPEPLSHIMFADSGSGSVQTATRSATWLTGRSAVLHGESFSDVDSLIDAVDDHVAAVAVEPIRIDPGGVALVSGDLEKIATRCRATGALLLADETRTALRAGAHLACAAEGVIPDFLVLGSSIAGGLPIGVVVMSTDIARRMRNAPVDAGAGNAVVFAAAAATLQIAASARLQTHARIVGEHLLMRLRALRLPEIRDVRGNGLLVAVELRHNAAAVIRGLEDRGLLVVAANDNVVRLTPPLIMEKRQADELVEALASVILATRRSRKRGEDMADVEVSVRGVASRPPVRSGGDSE